MSEAGSESVGSVSVDVVPDARGFKAKLDAELRDITAVIKAELDDALAREGLDSLTRERSAQVRPIVDQGSRARASSEIDWIARTRTAIIRVVTQNVGNVLKGFGLGAATGVALPAAAGLGAVAGGETLFGAIGLQQAKAAQEAVKNYTKLTAAAQKAQQAAQQAQSKAAQASAAADAAGGWYTPHQAATQKAAQAAAQRATEAQQKAQAAAQAAQLAAPTKQQVDFVNAQKDFKAALDEVATRSGVLKLFTAGLEDFAKLLPELTPIIRASGKALTILLDDFTKAARSKEGRQVIREIARDIILAVPLIEQVSGALGHIFDALLQDAPGAMVVLEGVFGYLRRVPSEAIVPLTAALGGLFLGGPWMAGAAAAGALFAQLYMHSKNVRSEVQKVAHVFGDDLKPAIAAAKDVWEKDLRPALRDSAPEFKDIGKNVGDIIKRDLPGYITNLGVALGATIGPLAKTLDLLSKIANAMDRIGAFGGVLSMKPGDIGKGLGGVAGWLGLPFGSHGDSSGGGSTKKSPAKTVIPKPASPSLIKPQPTTGSQSLNDIIGLPNFGRGSALSIGQVNVQAHDYHDFTRQVQRRHQRVAMGGVW